MSRPTTIVENSHYDHEEHGRVRVVAVEDDAVSFQVVDEQVRLRGAETIPKGTTEPLETFRRASEPADISVAVPEAATKTTVNAPGGN